jgi:hypothetical protein
VQSLWCRVRLALGAVRGLKSNLHRLNLTHPSFPLFSRRRTQARSWNICGLINELRLTSVRFKVLRSF